MRAQTVLIEARMTTKKRLKLGLCASGWLWYKARQCRIFDEYINRLKTFDIIGKKRQIWIFLVEDRMKSRIWIGYNPTMNAWCRSNDLCECNRTPHTRDHRPRTHIAINIFICCGIISLYLLSTNDVSVDLDHAIDCSTAAWDQQPPGSDALVIFAPQIQK